MNKTNIEFAIGYFKLIETLKNLGYSKIIFTKIQKPP